MKVKKVLGLLISIFVLFILSNNAFAVTPEGMSEELKNILNEEGKLVITDTTNSENKNQVLLSTINKYTTNEYGVHAYFTNSENTKCRIERYKKNPHSMLEGYDIDVKYEEKYSDEFKKVTEDGKIFNTSTSVTGKENLLWDYCDLFRSNDFSFNITDLNEDKTVGTLQMFKRDGVYSNVVEQHIV